MTQLFSNNVDTQLAATLSDSATTATLADGSGLNAPTGGDYELLTLIAAGNVEIVKVTARTGNSITIVRAQEGTAARSWVSGTRVFAGVTAGTLDSLGAPDGVLVNNTANITDSLSVGGDADADALGTAFGFEADATVPGSELPEGGRATAIGNKATASGYQSVAVGRLADAPGEQAVAVGESSVAAEWESIAIGEFPQANARAAVAIGAECVADGVQSIAIGKFAYAEGDDAIAIGETTTAEANNAIAIGQFAYVDAEGGMALGFASAETEYTIAISALPAVPKPDSAWGVGGADESNAAWAMNAPGVTIMSEPLNLKNTQTYTIPIPTGVTFFPDEVGVIVTAADTVSGQPTLRYGITGTETKYLAATATTGLAAAHDRQRFAALASDAGAKTLRAEVTAGATGTTLTGRIYWRGTAVVDA